MENPPEASDISKVFSAINSYQLVWDVFLHLFFGWIIQHDLPPKAHLHNVLRKAVPDIDKRKPKKLADNAEVTKQLFVFAFERLVFHINKIMEMSIDEEGITPMMSKFNVDTFRTSVFEDKGWNEIEQVLAHAQKVHDSALITVDGFDIMVGYFTTEGLNQEAALKFERELLLSLFQIVLNKGPMKYGGGKMYDIADFCVAIPHDRFIDVRNRDRDRYQYRHQFSRIAWSGIELSALLRKRLAILRNIKDPKGGSLEERLRNVMKKGYPELPNELSFQFGDAPYKMPLFIYVLRHTFWRPRDILYFYSALLAAADKFAKKKEIMPTNFVRQVIRGSIYAIIEDEFLDEFKTSFSNLRTVLRCFRYGPQVLSWDEILESLKDIKFETHLPEGENPTLEWKVEMLYDLGILGVGLDRDTALRLSAYRHSFSFNEGQLLTEKLERSDYPKLKFILHPAFVEYLHLDTKKNPELILPFTWDDLHENEDLHFNV